jgi:hypothetical protein
MTDTDKPNTSTERSIRGELKDLFMFFLQIYRIAAYLIIALMDLHKDSLF